MNRQKVVAVLFLLLFAFTYVKGQDRIITAQNDTILCKIVSVSLNQIQYEQRGVNQSVITNFIQMRQVKEYHFSLNLQDTPPVAGTVTPPVTQAIINRQPQAPPRVKQFKEPFQRWRIGFQAGTSHLLASSPQSEKSLQDLGVSQSQIDSHYRRLRDGIHAGADVHFLLTSFFGVGLNYSLFNTSVQMDYLVKGSSYGNIPTYYTMNVKEKTYVNYFGPSIVFQHWLDRNHRFRLNEELSVGYVLYREEDRFDPYQYISGITYPHIDAKGYNRLVEGNTWGGKAQVSLEYYPISQLSIGANAGIFGASFKTINVSDKETSTKQKLDKADYLNMSRVDYSVSLRFHF